LLEVDLYVRYTSGIVTGILKEVAPHVSPANPDPVSATHGAANKESLGQRLWRGFANPFFQLGLNAIIVTTAELLLKMGARQTAYLNAQFGWSGISGLASIWTWLGISCIIVSLVNWLYILRKVPLSLAFPLSNVVHAIIPLTSWIFLGEMISARRWLGIAFVLIGLFIVAKPFVRIEEKL
jgi:drug/metabolite transporter (DMT)-like permease